MNNDKKIIGDISGHIFQINASKGGVPKVPLSEAEVDQSGLAVDQQSNPEIHGGSDRALCLYSLERILSLQEEGHLIYPGAAGENITIAGLDWSRVEPGTKLGLGQEVQVEITRYTTPCNSIANIFKDNQYSRISQSNYPGWSRVYARVLKPGNIRTSDRVYILD